VVFENGQFRKKMKCPKVKSPNSFSEEIFEKSDLEHNAAISGKSRKVAYHNFFVNIYKKGFRVF
jgi:hypothetical protein